LTPTGEEEGEEGGEERGEEEGKRRGKRRGKGPSAFGSSLLSPFLPLLLSGIYSCVARALL
jgi:predicted transposase YdaD